MKILKETDLRAKRAEDEEKDTQIANLKQLNLQNMLALTDVYEQLLKLQAPN